MADNSIRTPGSGETVRSVEKSTIKSQVVILDLGGSGTEKLSSFPATDEDVAHSGGETLIRNGVKRTDSPAVSGGTTEDWSTLNCDASGLLWARMPPRQRSTQYSLVTQASAVAAADQLADEVELTGMALVAGGSGLITNMALNSNNVTVIAAELWLYQLNPSAAGTNAVHDQSDANMKTSRAFAIIDFSTWHTETSNMISFGMYRGMPLAGLGAGGLPYQCLDGTATTSLWGILVTRTAVTPGATTDYYLEVTHVAGV